jgi:hypothetical protein
MSKWRYIAWSLAIIYFLALILFGVFAKDFSLENHISTPSDFESWIVTFQMVALACLAISTVFTVIWCLLTWKYFAYGKEAVSKPYYRIWWVVLFFLSVALCVVVMRSVMEMPIEGKSLVYLFIVLLDTIVPYYLFTLVFTPPGAKFVPSFAKILRGARW